MRIQEVTFDTGVTINFAEGLPAGPPLVLLHGGSARWQSFENIIPELAPRWHLYAPDLRGHGQSGRVPNRYRLLDFAGDLIVFLERQVGEPAHLFGHSLGGIVALMIAGSRPELLRSVAIGDAPLTAETWRCVIEQSRNKVVTWSRLAGGQVPMDELVEALKNAPVDVPGNTSLVPMRQAYGEDPSLFDWLATNLFQNDPDMLTALTDDFENTASGYDMDKLMPEIHCPVLLLQADPMHGGLMTHAEVAHARQLLPHAKHVQLPGVSHALHHVHKEPVLKALLEFLNTD